VKKLLTGLTLGILSKIFSKKMSAVALNKIAKNTADTVKQLKISNEQLININEELKSLNLSIEEQNRLIQKGIEIAQESLLVQKYIALQQDKDRIYNRQKEISKHNLEQQSKYLREAFFHLKEELGLLEKPKISNLEKYLSTEFIHVMLDHHKITTKLTDNLFEKQLIQDSFNKIIEIQNSSLKEFNSQDKSDIKLIQMIVNNEINNEENKLLVLQNKRNSLNINYIKKIKNLKETQNFAFILKNYPKIVIKIK
tara:strand:- start:229 stop:990 length:762 start_codon:yes stop_codon:yes gene_type:complete